MCGPEGDPIIRWGSPERVIFWRSSMKPFQALPSVRAGVFDALGLGTDALAIACSSHYGASRHVDTVRAVLAASGVDQHALACGPHRPFDEASARAMDKAGRLPESVHNNCSGKHAAMLALARRMRWDTGGYETYAHGVQDLVRKELSHWLGTDAELLHWGVDGCGTPTPALPILEMGRAYARLAAAARRDDKHAAVVVSAMTAHPILIGGEAALSTGLVRATAGRLLGKEGAEGVFCAAFPSDEPSETWGAAFKVADGAMRAVGPAAIKALTDGGFLTSAEREALARFASPPERNTVGTAVGALYAED